jgi:acetyltransferase
MNGPLMPCGQPWPADEPRRPGPLRSESLALRNGRQVTLRPVRPDDAAATQRFIASLSPRSRLLRFHGAVNQVPAAVLREMTDVDQQRHVALVAEALTDDGLPRLVAEARYVLDEDGQAEFAVAVADDWQRLGLARALLRRLGRHAQRHGAGGLHGSVMAGNEPMLALMREFGADFRQDFDDASTVVVQLPG